MTKFQLALNIILFIPLLIINLFLYGIEGCAYFIEDVRDNWKKFHKKGDKK